VLIVGTGFRVYQVYRKVGVAGVPIWGTITLAVCVAGMLGCFGMAVYYWNGRGQ